MEEYVKSLLCSTLLHLDNVICAVYKECCDIFVINI